MSIEGAIFLAAKPRVYRKKRVGSTTTGPTLVGASYNPSEYFLTLTFDRPVNVTGGFLVGETITILDGPNESEILNAPDVEGSGTTTLTILMFANAAWVGEGVTMTAGAGTGIVDEDGNAWGGVTGLSLPYP